MNYFFRQVLTLAGVLTLIMGIQLSGSYRTRQAYASTDDTDKPRLVVQTGHNRPARTFAFSTDGALLASGSEDHTIILWEVATGRQLRSFKGHSTSVDDVAFSRDGRVLASVSNGRERSINLWDVWDGALLRKIPLKSDVHKIAFAADNLIVGLNKEDFAADEGDTYKTWMDRIGHINIWKADTGAEVYIGNFIADDFACSSVEPVLAIAEKFVPQFRFVQASFNPDQSQRPFNTAPAFSPRIKLIDLKSGKVLRTLKGHDTRIQALAFSADGKALASSSQEGMIKVWDRFTGGLLSATSLKPNATYSIQFGDDNRKIVGVRFDGAVVAVDTASKVSKVIVKIPGWGALGPGARSIAVASQDSVELWQPEGKEPEWAAQLKHEGVTATTLDPARMNLAVGKSTGSIDVWRLYKSRQPLTLKTAQGALAMIFGSQGELIARNLNMGMLIKWNSRWDEERIEYKCELGSPFGLDTGERLLSIDPFPDWKLDSSDIFARSRAPVEWGHPTIQIRDTETCDEIILPAPEVGPNTKVIDNRTAISKGGILASVGESYNIPLMAFGGPPGSFRSFNYHITEIDYPLRLINLDGKVMDTLVGKTYGLETPIQILPGRVNYLAFNNSGSLLAAGGGYDTWGGHIDLWDVGKRELKTRLESNYEVRLLAFNPQNEKELVSAGPGPDISIWNLDDKQVRLLQGHTDAVTSVAFNSDGRLIISTSEDNTIKLWTAADGKELATIVSVGEDRWIVTTPQGLFDTNRIEGGSLVNWVMDDDRFHALPVDIFSRDYFEPDLLRRVIRSVLKNEPLRTVRPLEGLNRIQPLVRIVDVRPESGQSDQVSVTVEVTNPGAAAKGEKPEESAAFDLRLFRAGKLVATYPPAKIDIGQRATDGGPDELTTWRTAKRFLLNPESGKFSYVFHGIHHQHCGEANQVEFTAYAFNKDRVRSETSIPYRYNLPTALTPACRRTYIISVGVGANQSDWDLAFAAKSADDVHSALKGKFAGNGLVDIKLLSKLDTDSPRAALRLATKENLRTVLDILAGREVSEDRRRTIPNGELLRKAAPDDLVVLYLSSHGYADPSGNFYIIPYDSGPPAGVSEVTLNRCFAHNFQSEDCQAERAFLRRSISADDFAAWWENVDAGEMVMILDSCYSASVPGRGFRPGPLGDRGFGQLAYDKGMLLLTAAQPDRPAIASLRLGSGRSLLADALVGCINENLNQTLSQCLRRAETRVPDQYKALYPNSNDDDIQSPSLLDFTVKK